MLLRTSKKKVLETRSLSIFRCGEEDTYSVVSLRKGWEAVTILSRLISHHEISFFSPHLKEKLCGHQFQSAEEIVTTQGKKNRAFLQISAMFPAATLTLADLHSGQQQLFSGMIWICVNLGICNMVQQSHGARSY
jgi:hypothetical protein